MKDIWDWLKASHYLTRAFVVSSLIIIFANAALIACLNNSIFRSSVLGVTKASSMLSKPDKRLTEDEYRDVFADNYQKSEAISRRLLRLMSENTEHSTKWRERITLQVIFLKHVVGEAKEITPPEKHTVAHMSYMKAVSEFEWAADNITRSIDRKDEELYSRCVKRLIRGEYFLKETIERLSQGL